MYPQPGQWLLQENTAGVEEAGTAFIQEQIHMNTHLLYMDKQFFSITVSSWNRKL